MMKLDPKIALDVHALQSGGSDIVIELFERNREQLRLFVMHRTDKRLSKRFDWDDVLQETFIVIHKRYTDFLANPNVPFFIWMRALAGQVLMDLHRRHLGAQKRAVGREVSLHDRIRLQSRSGSLGSMLVSSGVSPSGQAVLSEQVDLMNEVMGGLSDLDRMVLRLRHVEQMTNGEVAAALGIDKSAATKRYRRALQRLRERFPT